MADSDQAQAAPLSARASARRDAALSFVADVMIAPVMLVRPAVPLRELVALMERQGARYAVVDPRPFDTRCGIVALPAAQRAGAHARTARDAMILPPFIVAPAMRLEDCATMMLSAGTRRVIVMQAGQPVGIVCDSDIFQAIEARGY